MRSARACNEDCSDLACLFRQGTISTLHTLKRLYYQLTLAGSDEPLCPVAPNQPSSDVDS